MAGAYPTAGAPRRPQEGMLETAVVRDPWMGWRFGMALPPTRPLVYPFPQVSPPQDALARWGWYKPEESVMPGLVRRQPVGAPTFGYDLTWLGSRYVRPQIPEEAVARPAVEPGGYTVDELLGGNVITRRPGMNSNIPAAGK
jgi:hypothetical protein